MANANRWKWNPFDCHLDLTSVYTPTDWGGVTYIGPCETITIDVNREMRVRSQIEVDGTLIIHGNLVVDGQTFRAAQQADNPYTTKTGNYTVAVCDKYIYVNAACGNITITLPAISTISGQTFTIKRIDTDPTNTVTIQPSCCQTIDDESSQLLSGYSALKLHADDVAWRIV
jgi:hypothetical protein